MNAEILLMFMVGCDRAYLYGHPERELTREEQSSYEEALAQRSQGIPAQYITGHQEFWGMDLIVSPAVLIPRPETEHVIEKVLELVRDNRRWTGESPVAPNPEQTIVEGRASSPAKHEPSQQIRIADVGTGSGCIAVALAKELPQAEIHATEISPAALEVARANAARHQLANRIHFHETDLLTGVEKDAFDFVVSNPPYVGESEADSVQLEVRKFEPHNAVFAGPTGTEVIQRLVPRSREILQPGGWLVMEISGAIAERVRELLSDWKSVEITNDLQGIPRVAVGQKA
jgi:release factor glutamine methyltransferase